MRVRTSISDVAALNAELQTEAESGLISTLATTFELQDENRTGIADTAVPSVLYTSPAVFPEPDANASVTTDKTLNWRLSANKSTKSGCIESPDDASKVRCDRITAHFLRNWETIAA